jgi:hypothetical protein
VSLDASAFRLSIQPSTLAEATAGLPPGDGPLLLLAPASGPSDWPETQWQQLPERIRTSLPSLRSLRLQPATAATASRRAAEVAASDVVLASDPLTIELALYCGTPVVALGRSKGTLPARDGVSGVGEAGSLVSLGLDPVLQALGLS